jgi:ubiquitin-conjugating enzyme E2 J2
MPAFLIIIIITMTQKQGTIRLVKEYQKLMSRDKLSNFVAHPSPDDMFTWHFLVFGLTDCPYEGGFYVGTLKFPDAYPLKPPAIMMNTPSGRFATNTRLCLSISDYHPETWSPTWTIETIIIGLISFMNTEEAGIG